MCHLMNDERGLDEQASTPEPGAAAPRSVSLTVILAGMLIIAVLTLALLIVLLMVSPA
jgi:hypothetical protein